MEQLNKTPTQGKFGDVARVIDTNFGLIVTKLMELEGSKELNCGFYSTLSDLQTAYPNPERGMMAYVAGDDAYTYNVYRCKEDGTWAATGEVFKINISVDLSTLATKKALQEVEDKVTSLMLGAVYGGLAARVTNPGTPKTKVFYLPTEVGTYANFGNLEVVDNEVAFLYWNGSTWVKHSLDLSSSINAIKATADTANTKAANALSKATQADSKATENATAIAKAQTDLGTLQEKMDGLVIPKIVCLSQTAYDALPEKDPDTTYLTTEE